MADSSVHGLLLKEAQDEIAALRTELYSTRRLSEDRRQLVEQLSKAKDFLAAENEDCKAKLHSQDAELARLREVEERYAAIRVEVDRLVKENTRLSEAHQALQHELSDERMAKVQAQEAKARLEGDRSRLQNSRDDVWAQLRVAQQRVAEAEEEQCKAEEELVSLRAELQVALAQQANRSSTTVAGGDHEAVAHLLQQLESERQQSALLMGKLSSTKRELDSYTAQLQELQAEAHAIAESHSKQVQTLEDKLRIALDEVQLARSQRASLPSQQCRSMPIGMLSGAEGALVDSQAPNGGVSGAVNGELQYEHFNSQIQKLDAKVLILKKGRDKLLEEYDRQSEELDRVITENRALTDELASLRRICCKWENQSQDSLAHISRLKDLLEDSARWPSVQINDNGVPEPQDDLHSYMLKEQARNADLEVKIRALCAEMLKTHQMNKDLSRSMLPVLNGIESRLLYLHSTIKP